MAQFFKGKNMKKLPMIVLFLGLVFQVVYGAEGPEARKPLNIFVTLETEDLNDAMTLAIASSCKGGTAGLFTMANFYQYMNLSPMQEPTWKHLFDETRSQLEKGRWSVFKDKTNQFVLLLPEYYSDGLLRQYGFSKQWDYVTQGSVRATFAVAELRTIYENQKLEKDQLVGRFVSLFDKDSAPKVNKRIFLAGHGSTDTQIAGIPIPSFINLLNELNQLDCKFLIVLTCYMGGSNLVAVQESLTQQLNECQKNKLLEQLVSEHKSSAEQKIDGDAAAKKSFLDYSRIEKKLAESRPSNPLQFPIVVMATTGAVVYNTRGNLGLAYFFDILDKYLEKPREYAGTPKGDNQVMTIAIVLRHLAGFGGGLEVIPSIRFTGSNSFFRTLHLSPGESFTSIQKDVLTLSSLMPQAIVQQAKYRQLEELEKELAKACEDPELSQNVRKRTIKALREEVSLMRDQLSAAIKERAQKSKGVVIEFPYSPYLLIYISDLHDATLSIPESDFKKIAVISKIPGTAQHFIGTVQTARSHFDLQEVFIPELTRYSMAGKEIIEYGESAKAWFIEHFIDSTGNRTDGLVIYKESGQSDSSMPMLVLKRKSDGLYTIAKGRVGIEEPISPQAYYWAVQAIFSSTRANPLALKESTGGRETSLTEQSAFDHFMKILAMPVPLGNEGVAECMKVLGGLFPKLLDVLAKKHQLNFVVPLMHKKLEAKLSTGLMSINKDLIPILQQTNLLPKDLEEQILFFIRKALSRNFEPARNEAMMSVYQLKKFIIHPIMDLQNPGLASFKESFKRSIREIEAKYGKPLLEPVK